MICNPIIPIWLMSIICIALLLCKRKGFWPYVRQIAIVGLVFVINLRIMIPSGEVEQDTEKLNAYVIFVVDNTISMVAEDEPGTTRLDLVRTDCERIIQELDGARFSVVSFANEARVVCPFSNNGEYASCVIESLYPIGELYARGSSMNVSRDIVLQLMKNIRDKGDGEITLFFISDGEITNEEKLESFSVWSDYVDHGAVLGYGTEQGGRMRLVDYYGEVKVIQDTSDYPWVDAISRIDEDNLKKIAKDIGVEYIHMDSRKSFNGLAKEVRDGVSKSIQKSKVSGYNETYYWFAIPLAVLLGVEIISLKRKGWSVK